ncbi:MAG: hypothetical protein K2L82_07060 [Lachnospiraceae bacterium]|nr:hypothetical protein [Lachnospiraceae bacterium]
MSTIFFDILEINIVAAVAIIILCIFADKLRGRYGAEWMKLVWILLAVRLLIPYNFSLPIMEIRLLNYAGFEKESLGEEQGSDLIPENEDGASTNGVMLHEAAEGQKAGSSSENVSTEAESPEDSGNEDSDAQVAQNPIQAANISGESYESPVVEQTKQPQELNENGIHRQAGSFFYTRLLVTIWLTGVGIGAVCFIASYLFFAGRYQKSLRPVKDAQFIRQICMLQKRTIGHARLMVYQSAAVASPCLMGIVRPKLVLPADRSKWKKAELELIMAHEMCHYRRKDLWLKMLMAAVCCVHWFNPFVWLMKKQFFYDMELACDGSVLAGRDDDEREKYARVMLAFAGGRKSASAFSTSFGGNRKQMKARIDYMLDAGVKKKGRLGIVIAVMFVLIMGIIVSCGYKQDNDGTEGIENNGTDDDNGLSDDVTTLNDDGNLYTDGGGAEDGIRTGGDEAGSPSGQNGINFDYNHAYNDVIKGYQGDLYLAKEDGIYYLQGGQGEERLLYANTYEIPREMEIDGKNLYFCGLAPEGKSSMATVYRMDLDTHEVVDALAGFELKLPDYLITNVSVYEGNLYVALGAASTRTGFALDEKGNAVSQLDDEAPDFLYREYNDYMEAEMAWLNSELDSEEYWELVRARHQMYQAVIDVASCKKLLDGRQVVSQYKDESFISIYLENVDGTYEYVCDTTGFPMLVTETGIYYNDISGEIYYADFETKQKDVFYRRTDRDNREWSELSLVTYDADYVYLMQNKHIGDYYKNDGVSIDKDTVDEYYLVRVPRAGGEAQKVYRFPERVSMYGDGGWYGHCGVYNGRMYFDNRESFSLDPDVNGMQAINSGVPCEDAVEIKETIRAFAAAYFTNDEETLRELLAEDFEGTVDLYDYPEQADQIRETYVGGEGIPSTNIDIGVRVYVYYEFTGLAEVEDNTVAYLSMSMIKTQDGFRIRWYDVQL